MILNNLMIKCPFKNIFVKYYCVRKNNIDKINYIGLKNTIYSNILNIVEPSSTKSRPIFRVLQTFEECVETDQPIMVPNNEELIKMYKTMVLLSIMDKILYESQRQGRISFYMTNEGEEALQIGSVAGLKSDDLIYGQYRETGVLLYRGFTPEQFMDQCFGNINDKGRGRQMPVHYGSKDLNFVTLSSPLATQIPQAVGSAYSFKMLKKLRCAVVYFGEGAASEGDTHAAFNFAATLDCPIIFICRNNGYAISTPANEQYCGDGIVSHGSGYGIATIRVDGNDILAMRGHHSTSDDSTAYRPKEEIEMWAKNNPITKFKLFLNKRKLWNDQDDIQYENIVRKELLETFTISSKKKKPDWRHMFSDVYNNQPVHLLEQMKSLEEHLKENSQHYPKDF
ncbi:2-oxoisovalerate dehydrogenase subunit alpha, mitochondrial isoform X2 [Daktulosphaira vitifoliae]|uniref:2-oxoisovalerate dehydrogenase subunit alpha, mitochondrial isoform X2 n=1 Tax=Daktulosphaira vitifoliae TaxID=58002 RepID=UPI0021A98BEE|nr:2-oxoisovalerate dehydrogenase subunit alpha, mitochondrial isoform X2 [Daktulosphaira vitifoliae]